MNTLEWLDAKVKDLDRDIQLMDEVIKIIDQMLLEENLYVVVKEEK